MRRLHGSQVSGDCGCAGTVGCDCDGIIAGPLTITHEPCDCAGIVGCDCDTVGRDYDVIRCGQDYDCISL